MKLHSIETGFFKLDGGAMFGVVPKTIWQKLVPADEHNLCTWAMRCLLIEDGNRLTLIDTGIGNKQSEKFFGHYHLHGNATLEASLKEKGFSTNDVTDVILTHLHFDHCGGAVKRVGDKLIPAFENAIFWSNKAHWQWATQPNEREKASFLADNILPLEQSGQLRFIESDPVTNVFNGLGMKYMYGHTDAMMLPTINYKGNTLVYMADLLPSVAHIPLPYVMGYDMFPLKTLQEKKAFLEEAVANNYVLFFEHDAVHECCRLQQTEKGIRVAETFALSEL